MTREAGSTVLQNSRPRCRCPYPFAVSRGPAPQLQRYGRSALGRSWISAPLPQQINWVMNERDHVSCSRKWTLQPVEASRQSADNLKKTGHQGHLAWQVRVTAPRYGRMSLLFFPLTLLFSHLSPTSKMAERAAGQSPAALWLQHLFFFAWASRAPSRR